MSAKTLDTLTCSCGIVIVHVTGDFWRDANSPEVCRDNHWHKPVAQPVAADEREKEIRRSVFEELIIWNTEQAQKMKETIELAGDHYTYRDKLRHHEAAVSDLRQLHLYLLGYDESSKRLRELSDKMAQPVGQAERERFWFEDVHPIINAIGEISVQEAMNAVEKMLREGK